MAIGERYPLDGSASEVDENRPPRPRRELDDGEIHPRLAEQMRELERPLSPHHHADRSALGRRRRDADGSAHVPCGSRGATGCVCCLAPLALANEEARRELAASRARLAFAGRTARSAGRLERNLHDGAQQRLVSALPAVRLAEKTEGSRPGAKPSSS